MPMSNSFLTVSQLIQTIKTTLELNDQLRAFYLKGEISNFIAHRSGHWYFSLKDESSKIACVMFQGYTKDVLFMPKEGDSVLVRASMSVYGVQGTLQCSVFSMQNAGLGDLYIQFERLKKKLFEQGLFDDRRKKVLPKYPQKFAIITGRKTAALQDILKTFHQRWPMAELTIFESLVQGAEAPKQLIQQIHQADLSGADVIILARGGGSIEDLWAFNDESLALSLANLKTPLITGIGHESDTTIADMVADLRAPTPTAAVQLAVKNYKDVQAELMGLQKHLIQHINIHLNQKRYRLNLIQERKEFKYPKLLLQSHQANLSLLGHQLIQTGKDIQPNMKRLSHLTHEMKRLFLEKAQLKHHQVQTLKASLIQNLKTHQLHQKQKFGMQLSLLQAYSPLNSLERGYSLTYSNEHLVKSIHEVALNSTLKIKLQDGHILATATEKEPNHE